MAYFIIILVSDVCNVVCDGYNRSMVFSRVLANVERNEIGLYEVPRLLGVILAM